MIEQQRLRQESLNMKHKLRQAFKNIQQFYSLVTNWQNQKNNLSKDKSISELKNNYFVRSPLFGSNNKSKLQYSNSLIFPANYVHLDTCETVTNTKANNSSVTIKRDFKNKIENNSKQSYKFNQQQEMLQQKNQKQITFKNLQKELSDSLSNCGNKTIKLNDGWIYKGQFIQDKFHGYGELICQQSVVYSGNFAKGYFQGYGKIKQVDTFDYLINRKKINKKLNQKQNKQAYSQVKWLAYFGQFKKGNITGFGQLWLSDGKKIIGQWLQGRPTKNCILYDKIDQ